MFTEQQKNKKVFKSLREETNKSLSLIQECFGFFASIQETGKILTCKKGKNFRVFTVLDKPSLELGLNCDVDGEVVCENINFKD